MKLKLKKTKTFHHRVRVALAEAGLTQAQLAKKLGIPSTTLSDWLREEHPVPPTLTADIEKKLGLTAGELTKEES